MNELAEMLFAFQSTIGSTVDVWRVSVDEHGPTGEKLYRGSYLIHADGTVTAHAALYGHNTIAPDTVLTVPSQTSKPSEPQKQPIEAREHSTTLRCRYCLTTPCVGPG